MLLPPTMTQGLRRGGLVVSCQAREDNPLHGAEHMRAMALAAVQGGAAGIRAEGIFDVSAIRRSVGVAVMADIATLEEGLAAAAMGADYVGTTLAGYTAGRAATVGPDLELLAALVARCPVPVVAEGRFETPAQVARAFELGAYAVVVGTAITNPREITRRFVAAAR